MSDLKNPIQSLLLELITHRESELEEHGFYTFTNPYRGLGRTEFLNSPQTYQDKCMEEDRKELLEAETAHQEKIIQLKQAKAWIEVSCYE